MKKLLFITLFLTILVAIFTLTVTAETYGDLTYIVSNGKVTITDCSEYATSVYIPEKIDGYPVTSIGKNAFANCTRLECITIPDSVTNIVEYAFYDCYRLEEVHISDISSWCNIRFGNFFANPLYYAKNLYLNSNLVTNLLIPDSVTYIREIAFYNCKSLTSINVPDSVTGIGEDAFQYCTSLKEVHITNVASWCNISFYDKEANPFCYANKLYLNGNVVTNLIIPDSVKSIGDYAFENCTSLTSLTISDGVKSIGNSAFNGCTSLTSLTIHDGVTSIGNYAFKDCTRLRSITIPDSVTNIDVGAFQYCTSLEEITLPLVGKSVNATGDQRVFGYIFGYTTSDSFYNSGTTCQYGYQVNTLGAYRYFHYYIPQSLKNVTLKGCTIIPKEAFINCTGITSITISDGVKSIGDYAFENCTGLTSITIPNSVTSIGSEALYGCTNFKEITLPFSIELESIFGSSYDVPTSLKKVTITGGTTISNNAFSNCKNLTSITIPNSVKSIGNYAFYNCESLASITIPSSVTSIGNDAFYNCENLTSISIPSSVTSIGNYAFYYCVSLTSVTIPDGVTSIGNYAFKNCTSLRSITIPDSVTSIGGDAFYNTRYYNNLSNWENGVLYNENHLIDADTSITGVYNIKVGTKTIAGDAFSNCDSLTGVTIPDGMMYICEDAFYSCDSLTDVTIPNSVISVGNYAFSSCCSLASITFKSYTTEIYDSAATIYSGAIIYFYSGSTADAYATKYGRKFAELVCSHNFTKENTTYLKSDATCTSPAVYYESCVNCCKKGTETFEYGSSLAHNYTRKVITDDYKKSDATCTESAIYYYCCATCDKSSTATFKHGSHLAHNYTRKVITDDYKKSGATCIEAAVYYYCCATCDSRGVLSYTNGSALGHTEGEWVIDKEATYTDEGIKRQLCSVCSETIKTTSIPKLSLVFTLNDAGTEYSVTDCLNDPTEVFIPNTYEGLPVTSIGSNAFRSCSSLTSINIPDSVSSISTYAFYNCNSLANVYYEGSESDWEKIRIGQYNSSLTKATIYFAKIDYTPGDCDGDEAITIDDAIHLAFYTFYPDRYHIPNGMDVDFNGDGEVTIDDAIYLAFYTFYPDRYPINK